MARMSRADYAALYGPTTGDCVRLGDSELLAEIEHDHGVPGEECLHGGGKTLRDGIGLVAGLDSAQGSLDMLVSNAVVIDPVLGIVKGDIGIKEGLIAGVGKAGNPAVMDGVDPELLCGAATTVRDAEGLIATPGGIDVHVHFDSAQLCQHAIASGVTTMLGGSLGPITVGIDCGGAWNVGKMLQAAEEWPINFGFLGRGNSAKPHSLVDQIAGGCMGLKIHEDWGAMPAAIDTCLGVADEMDFQVQLHTDTLNESGFLEETLAAIKGRTIHMYHAEGAGGGHAPDIIRITGEPNCLPSSTNPTNPYTRNTFDEHLDMIMVCHHLNPAVPEDVAFAESRIRAQTIAAEDVLHDIGAISMLGSDSQGMGRINEVICRTWQLASKMRGQRGRPARSRDGQGRQRAHQALHREVHHQRRPHLRHRQPRRLAGGGQARGRGALAPGLLRHQAGAGHQGRLHRVVGDGRQRRLADDLRAAAHAPAVGRLRPGQGGAEPELRLAGGGRGRRGRPARAGEPHGARAGHAQARQGPHAAQRRLPRGEGRSRDLRGDGRRRARRPASRRTTLPLAQRYMLR